MDHAEAHEYIADLALEPGRLAALSSSTEASDRALLAHVPVCRRCASELAAWQSMRLGMSDALGEIRPDELRRIAAPASLRREVLDSVHSQTRSRLRPTWRLPRPTRRLPRPTWRLPRLSTRLAVVALAVILVAAGTMVIADQAARLSAADASRQALANALQTATEVLADPGHEVIALAAPDGTASGTVAWTRRDLVVLATGLTPPPDGHVYRCWVVAANYRTPVGRMDFVDGQAFWVGALDNWASVDLGTADSFQVTLESAQAASSGQVVLEGSLGG